MTVRTPQYFQGGAAFDGLFDWDFLDGAFGPTIRPMDLDAIVERRGWCLVFETKHARGDAISTGQRMTLLTLVRTGWCTVVLLWGKTAATIEAMEVWYAARDGLWKIPEQPVTAAGVYLLAAHWFALADAGKPFVPPAGATIAPLAPCLVQRPPFWWDNGREGGR